MDVGTTSQAVEVTAATPLLATDNAVGGGTVDAKVIHEVPMVQAKPEHLMFYTQGSQANNDGTYRILGLPSNQINFTIDGTLGGPIFIPKVYDGRNKSFFFLAFRLDYDHEQNTVTANVPTQQMLDGNFNFGDVASQPIYDPATITCTNPNGCTGGTGWTAQQFPGNQIPLSRFDPVAVKFLSMTPYHLPNTGGGLTTTGPTNNYIANTHYLADKDGYLGRFDQQILANNKAYFRFAWNRYREQVGRENILYAWHDLDNTQNSYGLRGLVATVFADENGCVQGKI